jgi:hypothetical protein
VSRPRPLAIAACALGALLALPAGAHAQTCNAPTPNGTCNVSTSTTLTVGTVLQLTLGSTTTTLRAPLQADYDLGVVADNGPVATIKCNRPWKLQIAAAAATWTAVNTVPGVSARANKPAADLTWGIAAGGPFTALSTVITNAALGAATASSTVNMFYQTKYNWTLDTPGAYSLVVVFTLTNQ